MSTFKKRIVAAGSALALTGAGLVGVASPAVAAGEVTLKPNAGSGYTVFNTDEFAAKTTVITAAVAATTLAYAITDADQGTWYMRLGDLNGTTAALNGTVLFEGLDKFGNAVDLDTNTAGTQGIAMEVFDDGTTGGFDDADEDEIYGEFLVDFTALGITTLILSSIDTAGASNVLYISPSEAAEGNAEGNAKAGIDVEEDAASPTGNSDQYDHGDGAESVTIQSWIDLDGDATDVEALYASAAQTVTWIDPKGVSVIPKIERFLSGGTAYLNGDSDGNKILAGSLQFVAANLNLDQVDLTQWDYDVVKADGTALTAGAEVDNNFLSADAKVRDGYDDHSSAGKIYIAPTLNDNIDHDDTYKYIVEHNDNTTEFGSVGFTLPTSSVDYHIEATVDTSDDLAKQTSHTDLTPDVLAGTNARTFTAQIKSDDDTVAETASVPVMAIVSYPSTYAPGTLTVSGSNETISSKSGYTMVNGFTDADGEFEVTVTSSTAVKDESYTVDFYVLAENVAKQQFVNLDDAGNQNSTATPVVTYKASDADNTALTVASSVLSGSTVTASFSVADIFGIGTNLDGTKTMQIELKATDTDNLKEYVAVAADGSAEITFTNWLGAGESDVLTATLFTGAQDDQTSVDSATLTLYNAPAVAAVQIPATITTNITYDDFLTGGAKTSTAAPAPNDGNVELKGTVVDANGAGVPGGVVTIKGAGLQFVEDGGTKYYTDEISVVANAAGVFDIDVYSHIVNSTGVDITVTAGGASATTKLKTYLPAAGVNGNNLVFSMDLPETIVMNKTYAVTVQLTDKWGNAVQTADTNQNVSGLSIIGTGSVQINSSDSAITKNFNKAGQVTVFVRSVKDIAGPGAVTATLQAANYDATSAANATALVVSEIADDVATTAWDETLFTNEIDTNVEVTETESATDAGSDAAKVNAGSFKGYVAIYARGYEGKRLSAKVGKDWVVVPSITNNQENGTLFRVVEFTGAGVNIAVRIYIDRVLMDTINLTTK